MDGSRWGLSLVGAALMGAGAGLPFAVIYLLRPQEAEWLPMVLVFGGLFAAGAAYALLLGRGTRRHVSWGGAVGAGATLLAASGVSIVLGFAAEGGLAGLTMPLVYALVMTPIVAVVALLYALAAGAALGHGAAWRAALLCGLAAGMATLVVVPLTDALPGWRVGGGDRAMIKVAWLGLVLGGIAAGGLYPHLLAWETGRGRVAAVAPTVEATAAPVPQAP